MPIIGKNRTDAIIIYKEFIFNGKCIPSEQMIKSIRSDADISPDIKYMFIPSITSIKNEPQILNSVSAWNGSIINVYTVSIDNV